jgi:hypothetical protein
MCAQEEEFLGCPVCHTPEEDIWVEVKADDPNLTRLDDPYRCAVCGIYFDFAQKHFDKLFNALPQKRGQTL